MDFDDVLGEVGSFGRYQKTMIFFFLLPMSFFNAFMMNQLLFQVVVPDHWCHVQGRETSGLDWDQWRNLTIPRWNSSTGYSSCLMYQLAQSEGTSRNISHSTQTQVCSSGWDFDSSQFEATLATTNGWFCEKAIFLQHVLALNMVGNALGTLVLPHIGDKYLGRRMILRISLVIYIVFTVPQVWISNASLHMLLRFLAGFGNHTYNLVPYVIVLEVIASGRRSLTTALFYGAWTTGMCFTALVAFLVPHWQYLALLSCLPPLIALLLLRLIPESPRWLISKGRVEECIDILLQIAMTNGRDGVSKEGLRESLEAMSLKQEEELGIHHVLRYPRLRLRTILVLLMAFCIYTTYGVVLMGINVMPSNYFVSHFLSSVFQFPSNLTGWVSIQYLGRRNTCIIALTLATLFCITASFCLHDEWALVLVTGVLKLCFSMTLQSMFILVSEIFPTPVRSSGLGLYLVFGLWPMAISPYILHSGTGTNFHYLVLTGLLLTALVSCILLPETLGLSLPQSFEEAEELGTGRPLIACINHWNLHRYTVTPSDDTELYTMQISDTETMNIS
nr:LOW QUALITY PROTEIN: beta-alanine transporter-like [Cherax quadricarinatus]